MSIIRLYFYREVGGRFLWLFPLLISLVGLQRLIHRLSRALESPLPVELIFQVWLLKLSSLLPEVLTISMFLAILISYARMQHDREILILSCGGLRLRERVRMALEVGALTAIVIGLICFWLNPWAEASYAALHEQIQEDIGVLEFPPGQFLQVGDDGTAYVEQVSDQGHAGQGLFLYLLQGGKRQLVVTAEQGFLQTGGAGQRWLELEEGWRYQLEGDSLGYQSLSFQRYRLQLPETSGQASGQASGKLQNHSLKALWSSDLLADQAKLQWYISQLISCLLLAPLAVLLYSSVPTGRYSYAAIFVGVGIYFLYYGLLRISESMMEQGRWLAELGMWWVHLGILAVILLRLHWLETLPAPKRGRPTPR